MERLSVGEMLEAIDARLRLGYVAAHEVPFKHLRECVVCRREMRETGSVLASRLYEPIHSEP